MGWVGLGERGGVGGGGGGVNEKYPSPPFPRHFPPRSHLPRRSLLVNPVLDHVSLAFRARLSQLLRLGLTTYTYTTVRATKHQPHSRGYNGLRNGHYRDGGVGAEPSMGTAACGDGCSRGLM